MKTKQAKIAFLVVTLLVASVLVSCIPGGRQLAKGWSGTAFHDGVVYVGTADGRVVAINSSTQSKQWDYGITPATTIYTTPIVHGGLVYVGTYSGKLYALSVAEGVDMWVRPTEGYIGAIVGNPVIADETIYISSSDGMVYALDTTRAGAQKWKSQPLADKLWTSPTLMGDALYVSTLDGHIYALSLETGDSLEWSFKSEAGFASSPVIYEGVIYVGSFDDNLYAVRIGGSEPLWRFAGGKWFWAAPLVSEGVVYAGCLDGKLYAIGAETGEELWQFESRDAGGKRVRIVSSPVLMDNLLIVVDEAGTVYVFDLDGGLANEGVPWRAIPIGADVRSPFCAHEGLVYVRGEDNWLYAVDVDQGEVSWTVSLTVEQ